MLKAVPGPAVKPEGAETTMLVKGVAPLTPSRNVALETVRLPIVSGVRKNVFVKSNAPELVTNIEFVIEAIVLEMLNVPPLTAIKALLGIVAAPTSDNKPPSTIVLA